MKKLKVLLSIAIFTFSLNASAQGLIRFDKEDLNFSLVNSHTGVTHSCQHELLSHVPWWRVSCDDREYTVDVWLQIRSRDNLFEKTLMYHVSEGVQSSGERLVQFQSHFTSFVTKGRSQLQGIVSRIDVRNGQADLVVRTR